MTRPETTRASDNFGAVAQARYFYQHHYIAFWCIRMLVDDQIEHIVCEHHEDFYIHWKDDHYDFVQVKTRTEGEGEWTIAKLTEKGDAVASILQKLYDKKIAFGNGLANKYVFVSDMGAGEPSGEPNLKTLKTLNQRGSDNWDDEEKAKFERILISIKSKLTGGDDECLRDFCQSLDIRKWEPNSQTSLERFNHAELGQALQRSQGVEYGDEDVAHIYESILQVVRDANIVEDDANLSRSVAEKTIQPEQILSVIEFLPKAPCYLERAETPTGDDQEREELTKIQEKTKKWPPDATEGLIDLRASARVHDRKYRNLRQAKLRLGTISLGVQRVCIRVVAESRRDDLDGNRQWLLLEKYLQEFAEDDQKRGYRPQISLDYLFGIAGHLTGKCKIRWAHHVSV
jgi:hypothetical protein